MKLILWIVMLIAWGVVIGMWGYSKGWESGEDLIQGLITALENARKEIKWLMDTNTMLEQENDRLKQAEEQCKGTADDKADHLEGNPE